MRTEQEHIDGAIVVKPACQRKDAFGKLLDRTRLVKAAHGPRDVETQAHAGAVRGKACLFQTDRGLLNQRQQLRGFLFDALFKGQL